MMKISTLLAINILVATSLVVASIGSNAIYGQGTQQNPTISPQPIRPDQQAAAQQQQQAAAQLQAQQQAAAQQQQAAAQQLQAQQQAAAQQQQAAAQQQQAAAQQPQQQAAEQAAAQQQTNQTSTQPQTNQTSTSSPQQQSQGSSSGQSGNLNTNALLNYTNNAVLALHGTHTSEAKQKVAEDNLAKIQQLLIKANPNLLPLSPTEIP
jgi:hypothetical protein